MGVADIRDWPGNNHIV